MLTCTQTEFAEVIGKNKSYVTRLKQKGRLVFVQTPEGERVDVVASKALIDATADPAHDKQSEGHDKGAAKGDAVSYNSARTRNELAKAQTAELELAQRLGQLVDAEEARIFAADLAASFRSALEILPDRLAPELVPLRDTESVRAVLLENFECLLGDLADKIGKWGKE